MGQITFTDHMLGMGKGWRLVLVAVVVLDLVVVGGC